MKKSIIDFPTEYVMIDTETTGYSPEYDSLLEIGALRVKDGEVVEEFNSFVGFEGIVPEYITELTGITTEMLAGAPPVNEAVKRFLDFLGDNTIVGFNVGFDINFLRKALLDYYNCELNNTYIDCLRFARRLFPEEPHHRLKDMARILNIKVDREHRASSDCYTTKAVFDKLRDVAIEKYGSVSEFVSAFNASYKHKAKLRAGEITSENMEFDETHPLYGKTCVFTGTLEKMVRKEAMQAVVDAGGKVGDNVTKDTNYLILGNNDYCSTIKGGKSSKHKKAESLILKGQDLAVIPENIFYQMLEY